MEYINEDSWIYSMMMTDFTPGPVYFFDQPTGRTRSCKMPVDNYFNLVNGGARSAAIKSRYSLSEVKINDDAQKLQNEATTTGKPDIYYSLIGALNISGGEKNPEAPTEQADYTDDNNPMDTYKRVAPYLLSELGTLLQHFEGSEEGCIPHGLVNVLNYSWYDLTAGAVFGGGSTEVVMPRKSKACNILDENLRQMKGKRKTKMKHLKLENESERHLHESNVCKRASVSHTSNAQAPTIISFSMSSKNCEEQGWIIQPKEPCCEEQLAQRVALCQWVVERLQRAKRLIGAVVAVWGQSGGLMRDPDGGVVKEWTWHHQTHLVPQEEIIIQVSDHVSVRLLSGTRASLSFTCQNERVQLPLSALSLLGQPEETACLLTEAKALTSQAGQEFSLPRTQQKHLAQTVDMKRERAPFKSVPLSETFQMVQEEEPERPEEPCAFRRGAGQAGRELRRLQKTVRRILDDWLEFYRIATGIKCPDTERISGSPVRPRQKTEVRSAVLHPSSPPTVPSNSTMGPPDGDSTEPQTNPRNQPLSALTEFLRPGSTHKMP